MGRSTRVLAVLVCCSAALAGCTSSGGSTGPSATPPPTATASSTESASSTPASPSTGSTPTSTGTSDWPMYHGRPDRAGISTSMPAVRGAMRVIARLSLDGKVYASPIVVGGRTFVATENDSVYAFDATYQQVWKKSFGSPSSKQERPCGNIDPLGITGTPIAANGLLYFVAERGGSIRHEMFAVDQRTGATKWQTSIDLPGADPKVMQQRGALSITGGRVWAPFGALAGDCGKYKGRLVGMRLDGSGSPVKYDASTQYQGGMWNPAGATVDADGHLFPVSANGSTGPGDAYDHTNSVNELDQNGKLVDSFAPSDWAQNNRADVGLGSQGVALVGTKWAVLGGKSGPVYVLRQGKLGGIGGQVSVKDICKSYGGAAVDGSVVYLPCTDNGVSAVRVDDAGALHELWQVDETEVSGSPVIGGGRVWAVDQFRGVLHALDPRTGKTLATIQVGTTSRFETPALTGRDVLVGTDSGLTVVRTS